MARGAHATARSATAPALAGLAGLAEQIRPTALAGGKHLEVAPALESLLPGGGLRRGSSISVDGPAATSLALALAARASADGAWVAAVGFPSLGLLAAAELGVALERFVLVADSAGQVPVSDRGEGWPDVIAALVDAFEIVLVHASHRVRLADARRLAARGRERGAVLVRVGAGSTTARSVWPEGADVDLEVRDAVWEGLGDGHGHLRARRVTVEASGRREAARPRRAEVWLPSVDGGIDVVLADPVPLRPRLEEAIR